VTNEAVKNGFVYAETLRGEMVVWELVDEPMEKSA